MATTQETWSGLQSLGIVSKLSKLYHLLASSHPSPLHTTPPQRPKPVLTWPDYPASHFADMKKVFHNSLNSAEAGQASPAEL
jgi:hypothetical protein